MTDARPLWTPSPERVSASRCARFIGWLNDREDLAPATDDYAALHRWSIEQPARFWAALWDWFEIRADARGERVLVDGERMPGARWFPDARLNFAENLLRHDDAREALVFVGEQGHRLTLTYAQLRTEVARVAAGLAAAGVGPGDRVAAFMPNRPETVVTMLAATSLGAVFSSCSPDFGTSAVLDRFGQIAPKVLVACDGYFYNGKAIDSLPRVREIVAGLPELAQLVVVPYLRPQPPLAELAGARAWADFGDAGATLAFTPTAFDHPVYILYSSGTTGVPKCIVHGAGGTLLQHLKELVLHTDVGRDDTVFYFTTCGWMMWNWLISTLATGARVVLFDGSPFAPGPETLWQLAHDERISVFGASAKYFAAVEKAELAPRKRFDLSSLRTVLSTGSPLLPASYDFIYRDVSPDVQLSSISGGTDIVSCFALGTPLKPVYRGQLQCLGLGMNVQVYDDDGHPLPPGRAGELVCTQPFPSMPVCFWNDPDGRRYHDAYFARFEGTWCHGDWAELTPEGGMIIHGRSDATLNPGGVRIGTAEIYRQVEKLPEVAESLVVGQDWDGDQRVILFVRLKPERDLDDALLQRIRTQIRQHTTPRHVPARIIQVPDIPRTISGKIVELAVRNVIHGRPVKNTDALANPEALEHFRDLPELSR